MTFNIFKITMILILAGCSFKHEAQNLALNIPYHEARAEILKNGWKPVVNKQGNQEIGIRAVRFRDMGYVEVHDCSSTGKGYCSFHFKNQDGLFFVVTTQESPFGDTKRNDYEDAVTIYYGITDELKY